MNNLKFIRLRKYTQALKDKDIKNIISEELKGYKITKIDKDSGTTLLLNDSKEYNKQILFKEGNIILVGRKDNKLDITTIKEGPELEEYTYEFRANGVILEKTNIRYGYSNYSRENKVPTSLISKRYVLDGKETIKLRVANLNDAYKIHEEFMKNYSLYLISFFYTKYESFMVNEDIIPDFKKPRDVLYSTHAFVNDIDVSHLYDIVKGPDKLLRIFDLYKGIINERNKKDIKGIHLGLINSDSFGYLELNGIKQKEDILVSKENFDAEYIKSISNIISEVTGDDNYVDSTDRDYLINAIKRVSSEKGYVKSNLKN